jgi:hypothetical protein
MVSSRIRAGLIGTVAVAASLASTSAAAPPKTLGNCLYLPGGNGGKNLIIMPGSTSLIPVVMFLGARLAKMSTPYRLVYFPMASCDALGRVNSAQALNQTAETYDDDGSGKIVTSNCTIDGAVPIDMAIGDTFYESCNISGPRSTTLGDFQGPQQAFVFAVPRTSQYTTYITAEEAHNVWACGSNSGVLPWVDVNFTYSYMDIAGGAFGAQIIISKAINLISFAGNLGMTSHAQTRDQGVADGVASSTSPDKTIGFLSAEVYDQNRFQLKALAFRGSKQTMAYLPDSDSTKFDKRNVRDGHYTVQAPMHMWAATNPDGSVVRPLARKMIDWMQGNDVAPEDQLPFSINDVYAQAGVVPKCAMKVTRTLDGGLFYPYVSEKPPCGCYFESKATGAAVPSGCVACSDSSGCSNNQICSYGFCE